MGRKKRAAVKTKRPTVSVPAAQYAELERIAGRKRVSVSWVIRDAISKYLAAESPLFPAGE